MARCFISVGSNIDAERNVRRALGALEQRWGALEVSPVYRAPAVGFEGPAFLNLVVGLHAHEHPDEIREALRQLEDESGRDRSGPKFGSRPLDLDLLLYDDLVVDEPPQRLPHPDIERYAFVLRPLAHLAGGLRHPVLGRTYADLDRELGLEPAELEEVELDP